jgi:hypothetical protein
MKIKTIKIKVTQDNQDFDLSEFFTGSNTIYSTNAQLIQEADGLYWHAFFTYQQQGGSYLFSKKHSISNEKKAPDGFEEALLEFVKTKTNVSRRVKNSINWDSDIVYTFEKVEDFLKLKSLGKGSINKEKVFLLEVLEFIKKFKETKNEV